jgi:hypothetical protein
MHTKVRNCLKQFGGRGSLPSPSHERLWWLTPKKKAVLVPKDKQIPAQSAPNNQ